MKTQIKLNRKYLLCTDSLLMNERIDHVRELQFILPKFKTVPNVIITIHSTDSPGNVMVAWSIEKDVSGSETIITISATSPDGAPNSFKFVCDYVVIGEL
jgi:hypothetical protein